MGKLRAGAVAASFALLALFGCGKQETPVAQQATAPKKFPDLNYVQPNLNPVLAMPVAYEAKLFEQFGALATKTGAYAASDALLPTNISSCLIEWREMTVAHQVLQLVRSHDVMVSMNAGKYGENKPIGGWTDDMVDKTSERLKQVSAACRQQLPALAPNYNPSYEANYEDGRWVRAVVLSAYAQQEEHLIHYADKWVMRSDPQVDYSICPALYGAMDAWRDIALQTRDDGEREKYSEVSRSWRHPRGDLCPVVSAAF